MRVLASVLLLGSVGCASTGGDAGGPDAPPTLEVLTPVRGSQVQGTSVMVTGRVTDDRPGVRVTVNGTEVTPQADGSFATTVSVASGVAMIETHAIDTGDNDVRDARAVLAGNLVASDGSHTSQLGAHVSAQAFGRLSASLTAEAMAIDFQAAALAMNPLYDNGGCLGAKIDIETVTRDSVMVALTPQTNRVDAAVAIENVNITMKAKFKVACISGSTTIRVHTDRARVEGDIVFGIAPSGGITAAFEDATVALDGFSLDINNVPGEIDQLLRDEARDAAEKALLDTVREEVPPELAKLVEDLVPRTFDETLLDHATNIAIAPAHVTVAPAGLLIAFDSHVAVEGGEGGVFAQQSGPLTHAVMPPTGVGIAVATDTFDQLFAGLWAAGALEYKLDIAEVPALAVIFDDDARTVVLDPLLPPSLAVGASGLELAIGDLVFHAQDAQGADVQTVAMSLRAPISAQPGQGGTIALTIGQPTIFAQVLAQTDVVDAPLTDERFEGILNGAWGLVSSNLGDALGAIELPTIDGLAFGTPSIAGRGGYLVADVPVP